MSEQGRTNQNSQSVKAGRRGNKSADSPIKASNRVQDKEMLVSRTEQAVSPLQRKSELPRPALPVIDHTTLRPTNVLSHSSTTIQPKMTVNAPDDQFEVEADRVADQVMRLPNGNLSGWGRAAPTAPALQLKYEVMRSAETALPPVTDIASDRGKYNPTAAAGKHLLAHELTHTIQQTAQRTALQRREDEPQTAAERAAAIQDAFGFWGRDVSAALRQISGQSNAMLRAIRSEYMTLTGNKLEADFQSYGSREQFQQALSYLYGVLTVEDRLQLHSGMVSENEEAMLDVLRTASRAELDVAASSSSVMSFLEGALNDDQYYEARKLLTPDRMYEIVVERIQKADGWFNDDESAVYNTILDLTPADRQRLWQEQQSLLSSFLNRSELESVRILCLGSEAAALEERMELATDGLGTDNEAVALVAGKAQSAGQEAAALQQQLQQINQQIDAAFQQGTVPQGLIDQQREIRTRLNELGAVETLLSAEYDEDGELAEDSFLGMMHGDISEGEFQAYAEQMGVDTFDLAKQQILDAIGFWSHDEAAVYAAIDRLPLEADERARLLSDPEVAEALAKMSGDELAIVDDYESADSYAIAIRKLEQAVSGFTDDEAAFFKAVAEMSEADRQRLLGDNATLAQLTASLTTAEREIVTQTLQTGQLPTEAVLDQSLGGSFLGIDYDGTNEDTLKLALESMTDSERFTYRLGYYLHRQGQTTDLSEEQSAALEKFRTLYDRFVGDLGEDALQTTLDQLLGTPTLQELSSEGGMEMSADIMNYRVEDKMAIRNAYVAQNPDVAGLMDAIFDEGGALDQAGVQFQNAFLQAMQDNTLTEAEFAVLAALDSNFASKYQAHVGRIDQITNIASTVAAIAAGIAVVVLSGGSGTPAVIAYLSSTLGVSAGTATALTAGLAGATAKVVTAEAIGDDHYDAMGAEGGQDALVGFIEGAMAVVGEVLAARFSAYIGLRGAAFTGELSASTLRAANAATSQAGKSFVEGGLRGTIDGLLSGMVGEVTMTALDENTWRQSIWDILGDFGMAIIRGGGIGAVTGGVLGGSLEALVSVMGVNRAQRLLVQLEDTGISSATLDSLDVRTVQALARADEAIANGNLDEATNIFQSLRDQLPAGSVDDLHKRLYEFHTNTPFPITSAAQNPADWSRLNAQFGTDIVAQLPDDVLSKLDQVDDNLLTLTTPLIQQDPQRFAQLVQTYGDDCLAQLETAPFRSLDELEKTLQRAQKRIDSPITGLYQDIDVNQPPLGWQFTTSQSPQRDGKIILETTVTDPQGNTGYFERAFNPRTGQFELSVAFLEDVQPWVSSGGVDMVPNRGIPTTTYVTLYQAKVLGVDFGKLNTVKMSTIQNIETIAHLDWLQRQHPSKSIDELIVHTHSVQYGETAIVQSGHKVLGAEVKDGYDEKFSHLLDYYVNNASDRTARRAQYEAILQKYGLQWNSEVFMDFNIYVHVAPYN